MGEKKELDNGGYMSFVQTHRMFDTKSEPSCTLWTWVIMMCPPKSISCNTCATVMGMLITEEAVHVWGAEGIWELYVLSSQCYELKTALKVNVLKK